MEIKQVKLIYFSPTGTSKAIIQSIAQGINHSTVELIDITRPAARKRPLNISENELLVIAVPVYMGRVPALLDEWLHAIKAQNTPVVCVVVYGNRVYDNALLELKDILTSRGCIPIAGAAYIGEHSYSSSKIPTAGGRPDTIDLKHAELFGQKIREKVQSISMITQVSDVYMPGTFPYGGITKLWNVNFIAVSNACKQCGICAESCPVGAIDLENSHLVNIQKCITCCACIKNCPEKARTMKPGPVKDAAIRLNNLYKDRKDPEYFL